MGYGGSIYWWANFLRRDTNNGFQEVVDLNDKVRWKKCKTWVEPSGITNSWGIGACSFGVAEYRYEGIIPRSVVGTLRCNAPTEFVSSFSNAVVFFVLFGERRSFSGTLTPKVPNYLQVELYC